MKFNAVLTKEQAKEMFAYLEDIFYRSKGPGYRSSQASGKR